MRNSREIWVFLQSAPFVDITTVESQTSVHRYQEKKSELWEGITIALCAGPF
jgi:hypothetical protein